MEAQVTKLKEGNQVIVNTGGRDIIATIHNEPKIDKGHYWKEQDSYRCRFENGTSQYIPAKYCRKINY